jgi:hypothetical protein
MIEVPSIFCPKCGQPQAANETRFCSRCGFPLAGVVQLVSTGGAVPQMTPGDVGIKGMSPRQRATRQGLMMMLSTILVVPLVAILTVNLDLLPQMLIPLTAMILFIGGLLRIIYGKLFEENWPRNQVGGPATAYVPPYMAPPMNAPARAEIGGKQSIPATAWQRPRNTAELVNPPSVTENTTRLLDQNPEAK